MPDLSSLERKLEGLAPRPMSKEYRANCDDLIANLARRTAPDQAKVVDFPRWTRLAVVAAVVALSAVVFVTQTGKAPVEETVQVTNGQETVAPAIAEQRTERMKLPVRNVRERIYREATVEDEVSGVVMTVIDPVDAPATEGSSF